MRRLVYAPKVWAYVKGRPDANGNPYIYDVSDYIVSGDVQRRVNEVSSAELTLRNPNRMFTQLGNPAFLPMDPITIFLQRHIDKPARVFTGWLDESPYYQMYPGTCSLKASCTLKKLQYTFWDPALPFVMDFMKHLGWFADISNGLLWHPATALGGPTLKGDISKQQLKDGSLGHLLYAILNIVGGWDDNHIWIENLPTGLIEWITSLFKDFVDENDRAKKELEQLFGTMIGTGGIGSGGGTSGVSGTGPTPAGATKANIQTVYCIAQQHGVPPELVMAVITGECNWNPTECSGCCVGWFQINCGGCDHTSTTARCTQGGFTPNPSGKVFTHAETQDLPLTCDAFCQALKTYSGLGDPAQWYSIANHVQGCGVGGGTGNCYGGPSTFAGFINQAKGWINQYCQGVTCSGGQVSSGPKQQQPGGGKPGVTSFVTASVSRSNSGDPLQQFQPFGPGTSGTSSGSGGGSAGGGAPKINIANMLPDNPTPERIDEGVDYAGNGRIVAITDSVFVDYCVGCYSGNRLTLRFTTPPLSQGGCDGKGTYYIAEHITPVGYQQGKHVPAGTVVAQMSGGIEVGWWSAGIGNACGAPQVPTHDSGGPQSSAWGKDFSNLIVASGGPAGVQENNPVGNTPINDWKAVLAGKANFVGAGQGGSSSGGGGGGSGDITDMFKIAKGTAFATELQWPTIAETIEAVALQGHKSLMNDKPLLPFIQQVAGASMRQFQSAPNGDFYAFYPNYFGEYTAAQDGARDPYWQIDDVEVMSGDIQLTDANLVTHMYVVGDTLPAQFPSEGISLINKILSSGTVDIFDFFGSKLIGPSNKLPKQPPGGSGANPAVTHHPGSKTGGWLDASNTPLLAHSLHTQDGGTEFLNRYGARPVELDQPLIRSQYFEAFMAVQQFMLAWSAQFLTGFSFTFMPELYPGGRVIFGPPHNIIMYINSVTHNFDYEQGFTTDAELMAPAAINQDSSEYTQSPSWGMVNALMPSR